MNQNPPFPTPEELQAKLSEFMKSNFGDKVSFASFAQPEQAEAGDDEPPVKTSGAEFVFDFLPRDIKAHLDRVPAIDRHDHLKPFPILQATVRTLTESEAVLDAVGSGFPLSSAHVTTPAIYPNAPYDTAKDFAAVAAFGAAAPLLARRVAALRFSRTTRRASRAGSTSSSSLVRRPRFSPR